MEIDYETKIEIKNVLERLIYDYWENGDICCFDDIEYDWNETLSIIRGDTKFNIDGEELITPTKNLVTSSFNIGLVTQIIDLYRKLYKS